MSLSLFRQTDAEIEAMRADPDQLWKLTDRAGQDDRADPDSPDHVPDDYWLPDDAWFQLENTYQALHFLLTGTAFEGEWPLNFLLVSATGIGDDGAATAFNSAEVVSIATALKRVTRDELWNRFDLMKMKQLEIYRYDDGPCTAEQKREWFDGDYGLAQEFAGLKRFVTKTARLKHGLLIRVE